MTRRRDTYAGFRFDLREASGACGDLGTLLPLMLGAVAGLAPTPVILGFALFYIATALLYRLPVPVQPMKAIVAVLLVTNVAPASLAASGVVIGLVLLLLGFTGWIDRLGRLVPQSVLAGLQLGLGLALGPVSFELMADAPLLAVGTLTILAAALLLPRVPVALIALVAAVAAGQVLGFAHPAGTVAEARPAPMPATFPTIGELGESLTMLVLPQLALTLTNAILLTSLLAGDYFGERSRDVTPRRLSLSTGAANVLLAPFGALPMCHGAAGLAAHHRFGARSGGAPLMMGVALLLLAALPAGAGLDLLAAVPIAALGAFLLVAAGDLAFSRRLFDSRPSCWPVIAVTATATLAFNPFWGLVTGALTEAARQRILRMVRAQSG